MILYSYRINIETGEVKEYTGADTKDYCEEDIDEVEYATFNEDGRNCVYSESLVSIKNAKTLVLEKCIELRDKFNNCIGKLT